MKKISVISLILVFVSALLIMTGCGAAAPGLSTGKNAPWRNANHRETVTYDITRYAVSEELDEEGLNKLIPVAEGTFVYDLVEIKNLADYSFPAKVTEKLNSGNSYGYSLLTASFTLKYNPDAEPDFRGKTDTIESKLLFYTADLMPIYLNKTQKYASNGTDIKITTDYINGTNEGYINDKTFNTEVKSDGYDSEFLYYVIRTYSSLTAGGSGMFNIFSSADSAIAGESKTYEMRFAAAAALAKIDKDDSFLKQCYRPEQLPARDTEPDKNGDYYYTVDAVAAQVGINSVDSGSITTLFYAKDAFNCMGAEMENVLLVMQTSEYDPYTKLPTFYTSYTISGYSIA